MEDNKKGTLLYKFTLMFLIFGTVLICVCGVIAYLNEDKTYNQERLDMTRNMAEVIEGMIQEDPEGFADYVDFYKAHCNDMKIDLDAVGYQDDYNEFIKKFIKAYPGKVFLKDVMPSDMPYELQLEYYEYLHEYWLSELRNIQNGMGFEYVYFTVPDETDHHVLYVCDVERAPREEDLEHMMLGIDVFNDPQKFAIEWEVWENGSQGEFQELDNEWGHVYTYYKPVVVNGRKVGLINIDIQFDSVNQNIFANTVRLMAKIMVLMTAFIVLLMVFLYRFHLRRIIGLTGSVRKFSETQDFSMSKTIRDQVRDNDELSQLSYQTADMIDSMDRYVKELISTHNALNKAQQDAALASIQAKRDSLTGIRNRLAYDEVCKDIDYRIADGFKDFGIIMIDLNFLKRINDTYGHDKGNVAIKILCEIVCKTFAHSPVFRIGGDEFVVIIENDDFVHHEEKFMEFLGRISEKTTNESLPMWERISAAAGKALFNPEMDQNINNVFKRADNAMYENKKNMKALRR